jgi:ABC-type uncharacterized transport system permease subunit
MVAWLHLAALVLYGSAAALMGYSFVRGTADRRLPVAASGGLAVALAAHTAALAVYTAYWRELPLLGLGPSLSTLAYLLGLGTLVASSLGHARAVGLVLFPVVTVLVAVAGAVGVHPSGEVLAFQDVWFTLHVVLAFDGYVGLTLAFGAGLMYLLQFRELKSKRFGAIFRFFPPLDTLDRLGRLGILVGFPFLTVAMLVGWAWMARFDGALRTADSKLAWVIVSWVVFLAAIVARLGGGRRARRGALASVIGFVLVVVIYVVMRVQTVHAGAFL